MAYTKNQIIAGALDELGLASDQFDVSPEQLESALRRLDAMMGEWQGRGVLIGYPVPSSPSTSALSDSSNLPYWAVEAVILSLALRLAPSYGKAVLAESRINAMRAYQAVLQRVVVKAKTVMPADTPMGAGYKLDSAFNPFYGREVHLAEYASSPATGFTVDIADPSDGITTQWVNLTPAATLATGTINLPDANETPDGNEVYVSSSKAITALTIGANNALSISGAPTTIAANGSFRLRYTSFTNSWHRVL